MSELLPCPFCGVKPNLIAEGASIMSKHYVCCDNEECFGPRTTAGNIKDSIVQWNTRPSPEWQPIEAIKKPHRTMTPEEYAGLKIVGWHQVCKNVDLAGNVGVRYGADDEQQVADGGMMKQGETK